MQLRRLLLLVLTLGWMLVGFAPLPQVPIITLSARSGFDGRFRDSEWMPVIVNVTNTGDAMTGRLVVRPETSGSGVTNTYSAPVNLPNGAEQTVTLYVTARSFASQIRVELIDDDGLVVAAEPLTVRALQPLDRLYAVVTQSAAGSVDLTGAHIGSGAAYQTNWTVEDIPDHAPALRAVNMILFSDVDTSNLSSAQREALQDWVLEGGHLIVTGGAAWEGTVAGISDLLAIEPSDTITAADLNALADWLHVPQSTVQGDTVLATGTLREDARVLVEQAGTPLVVRRTYGGGTIDFISADPNTRPLRGWQGLNDLWTALATTIEPTPGWSGGFSNWELASSAVEILPGYNLLPDVYPLCMFLGLYIALIGPLNYFILAKLNRREFAWLTIPILIVAFSAMAYILGFNLRGTEATLSRMNLVQSWPEGDHASVESLVGLLSPRRTQYDLAIANNSTLRPLPRVTQGNLLTGNVQQSVDVQQTDQFQATDFTVDASFVAGFNAGGAVAKPDIGGSASMALDESTGEQRVRGVVSNRSAQTLESPVILARGVAWRLEAPLEPGDTEPFEFVVPAGNPPTPLFYNSTVNPSYAMSSYYSSYYGGQSQTITDLLGDAQATQEILSDEAREEAQRRRLFVGSFVNDFYLYSSYGSSATVSTGRGDNVYLAGWASDAPLTAELQGAQWNSKDTSLYLVELEVEHVFPAGRILITPDQFTWISEENSRIGQEIAPVNLSLQPGDEAAFRYTPLPSAVLDTVDRLTVRMERSSSGIAELPIYVYNWDSDDWDQLTVTDGERTISDPEPYLGPENAVLVRLVADDFGGYIRVDRLVVEQLGTFASANEAA